MIVNFGTHRGVRRNPRPNTGIQKSTIESVRLSYDTEARRLHVLPVDPKRLVGVPLTQADWGAVFAAVGMASRIVEHSWPLQDASGNPTATVGTALTANGSLKYRQVVAGWERMALRFTAGVADRAAHGVGVGINPSTTSMLLLAYIDITETPGAVYHVLGGGGATSQDITARITTTPRARCTCVTGNTDGSNDPIGGGVRPWVVLYDRTGGRANVYTDQDRIVGTYNAGVTDGAKGLGACSGGASPAMDVLWATAFSGPNAEWTDAQVKAVLQALNWTVAWSP